MVDRRVLSLVGDQTMKARSFPVPPATAFLVLARKVELLKEAGAPQSAIDKMIRRDALKQLAEDRELKRRPSRN